MGTRLRVSLAFFVLFSLGNRAVAQDFGNPVQYFPQVVAGSGAVTLLSIHNPANVQVQVRVEVFDSAGVRFYDSDFTIGSLGTRSVTVGDAGEPLRVGWARLTAENGLVAATEFFQISVGNEALPRVGVLPCPAAKTLKFFAYLVKGQTNSGIAIANPSETETAQLTVRRYNSMGSLVETVSASLQPLHQLARFLNEEPWFPGLENFEGIVEVQATKPVSLVMLRSDDSLLASASVLTPSTAGLNAGAVTTELLANGAVTNEKIADGAVTNEKLADGAVTGAKIANGTISKQDFSAIGGTAGQVLGTDGTSLRWQDDSLKVPATIQSAAGYVVVAPASDQNMITAGLGASPSAYSGAALAGISQLTGLSGVYGASLTDKGLWGASQSGYGVYGESSGESSAGVYGTGLGSGVHGYSAAGHAIHGEAATGYAGYFQGRVLVQGNLSCTGSKFFKIDHPLDPENKYLLHAAVESPEALNFYSGNAVLDATGAAEVTLPGWFDTLNIDFRYALTPVGAPGPGLFIAEKVKGNRFRIAGGAPGSEVSWQVIARRNDPGIRLRPFNPEEWKPSEERGTYLDPAAYGQQPGRADGNRFRQRPASDGPAISTTESLPTQTQENSAERR